jgi:hypothetical protein
MIHGKIKSRISVAKAAFSRKKILLNSKLDFNLQEESKCYIWSRALYSAEPWTLRKIDYKCLQSIEMWSGEVWERPLDRSCEK